MEMKKTPYAVIEMPYGRIELVCSACAEPVAEADPKSIQWVKSDMGSAAALAAASILFLDLVDSRCSSGSCCQHAEAGLRELGRVQLDIGADGAPGAIEVYGDAFSGEVTVFVLTDENGVPAGTSSTLTCLRCGAEVDIGESREWGKEVECRNC